MKGSLYICWVSVHYPLFLLAGLTLAIPILIHLFNLRKYKTVYFPSIRFLQQIQLRSQKQSEVQYKRLLAARILFLLLLVLAFAQPFFNQNQETGTNRLHVIYLDNSYSMSAKNGALTLLENAKKSIRTALTHTEPNEKFLLLTNDKTNSYKPISADKISKALDAVDISSSTKTAEQILNTVQTLVQTEGVEGADLYYCSDFQQHAFEQQNDPNALKNIRFYGLPFSAETIENIHIDTAFLSQPFLYTDKSNQLVVVTKWAGEKPKTAPVLQLQVDGQVKAAASLSFENNQTSIDTFNFQVSSQDWHQILITVNDAQLRYDDSFRITARSAANQQVLVLNEGNTNPFLQAAFQSCKGIKVQQQSISTEADWLKVHLVVLNGVTDLSDPMIAKINQLMLDGKSLCIFPGRTENFAVLSDALSKILPISISGIDTASKEAGILQQGSDLVKDLFEQIPENVQLPKARWHYVVRADWSANQQSILSYRNGDAYLAQFNPNRGKLYLLTTSIDQGASNFSGSYFFVPFLYQMAVQSSVGGVFSVSAGSTKPIFIPTNLTDERSRFQVHGNNLNIIPAQRPSGSGMDIYFTQSVEQPGFYALTSSAKDSVWVALNQNKKESNLQFLSANDLKKNWGNKNIFWLGGNDHYFLGSTKQIAGFPLWKVCVILALLMLAVETYLLTARVRKPTEVS